jgi:O-antigen/teichoic acid export membrane protein
LGIVSRQASIATLFSYLGVLVGFVNVTLLMTQWFTEEQFGLRETLLSVAIFSSQFAHLGTYRSLVKFYPFFNQDGKNDNGLLSIGLLVPFIGFLIVSCLMILFKPLIVEAYAAESPLFVEYFWFAFPLFFLLMYNNVFESYLQSRSKTAFSVFIKSIFNRLVVSLLLFLYYIYLIDFYWFIVLFIFSYVLNILMFIIYLYRRDEFDLKLNKDFFNKRLRKVYYSYSSFSILSGASSVLINKIDTLMIASYIGLASTAIYGNALYLCMLINIPGESIGRISLPLISKSWKKKKINEIESIYKKTSVTQFLIGGAIFVLMWGSIDNFYSIQGKSYYLGKSVFFIIASSKLINLLFGANGQIVSVSKYYRFDTTTAIILGILTIVTNILFIPIWGIEAAAIATASTIVVFNLLRFVFVYVKLKIQPFSLSTLYVFLILAVGFLVNEYIPFFRNIYIDTIVRSVILSLVIAIPAYMLKVSDDINAFIDKHFKLILRR